MSCRAHILVLTAVGVEELRFRLAAVGALAVPPLGTISIYYMTRGTADLKKCQYVTKRQRKHVI